MKQFTHTIFVIIAFVYSIQLFAQEDLEKPVTSNFGMTLSPQHALVSSFRISLDKQISNSSSWIILSPSFTSSYTDMLWMLNYDRRIGWGATLSHRYFVNNPEPAKGVYFQYGVVYNYNQLTYEGLSWVQTSYVGTEAITTDYSTVKDHIHQYGFDILIGYQAVINKKMLLDFYFGIGNRNSITVTNAVSSQNSNGGDGILAPDYRGVLPLAGMRIGFLF